MARVAGENMLGGKIEFQGSLGTQVVKVFDQVAARTGLRDKEALEAGFDPLTVALTVWDHKVYYPGAKAISASPEIVAPGGCWAPRWWAIVKPRSPSASTSSPRPFFTLWGLRNIVIWTLLTRRRSPVPGTRCRWRPCSGL